MVITMADSICCLSLKCVMIKSIAKAKRRRRAKKQQRQNSKRWRVTLHDLTVTGQGGMVLN